MKFTANFKKKQKYRDSEPTMIRKLNTGILNLLAWLCLDNIVVAHALISSIKKKEKAKQTLCMKNERKKIAFAYLFVNYF